METVRVTETGDGGSCLAMCDTRQKNFAVWFRGCTTNKIKIKNPCGQWAIPPQGCHHLSPTFAPSCQIWRRGTTMTRKEAIRAPSSLSFTSVALSAPGQEGGGHAPSLEEKATRHGRGVVRCRQRRRLCTVRGGGGCSPRGVRCCGKEKMGRPLAIGEGPCCCHAPPL